MKNISHIVNKVYGTNWLITPMVHRSIQTQLENILMGKAQMPDMPEEDEEEAEEQALNPTPEIVLINIDGIIGKHLSMLETECGGCDLDTVCKQLIEVRDNPAITGCIISFNTPGGTVTGVAETAELIAEVSKTKTVIGYTDTLCCSAGIWLASQCSYFYCSPSSDVGSVGVYSIYLDESAALAMEGVKVNAISAGKYKLTGASFKPMTDEERAMLQDETDRIYNDFKSAVSAVRKVADEDLQGQVYDGKTAVVKGFADGNINSLIELVGLVVDNKK